MIKVSTPKLTGEDRWYRVLQASVGISLFIYAILGLRVHYLLRANKIPFCSAAIFETAPNKKQRYTIRIHKQANVVYNPPKYFIDAQEMFENATATPAYLSLFEVFGKALEDGDTPAIARWRSELEPKIVSGPLVYDMVLIEYNPAEFVKDRSVLSIKILGEFVTPAMSSVVQSQ